MSIVSFETSFQDEEGALPTKGFIHTRIEITDHREDEFIFSIREQLREINGEDSSKAVGDEQRIWVLMTIDDIKEIHAFLAYCIERRTDPTS